MVYCGRTDDQIKLHGYRIELGEIENYLLAYPGVRQAAVTISQSKEGEHHLIAYIAGEVGEEQLKIHLSNHLPSYMIPHSYMMVEKIPLTKNGKADKKNLPRYYYKTEEKKGDEKQNSEMEEVFILVLNEIFPFANVSLFDHFYHLGGDSIKAIQISSRLQKKGYCLKTPHILNHPALEEMVKYIEETSSVKADQEVCEGTLIMTPILSCCFEKNKYQPFDYNQSVEIRANGMLETRHLKRIIEELVKHHDSFRLNYNPLKKELFYNNELLHTDMEVTAYELTDLSEEEKSNRIEQVTQMLKKSVNIEQGPLLKACIFHVDAKSRVFLTAHHIAVDGISWSILFEDFHSLLLQQMHGEEIKLPNKTSSFQSFAQSLANYDNEKLLVEKSYWNNVLNSKTVIFDKHLEGCNNISSSGQILKKINKESTDKLLYCSNEPFHTKPEELLTAALFRALGDFFDKTELVIDMETHGREGMEGEMNLTRTIGWFTGIYPFCLSVYPDIEEHIINVKEQLRRVPQKGLSYGILRYGKKELHDLNRRQVKFNYLGDLTMERFFLNFGYIV